jgi:hypothetical protein
VVIVWVVCVTGLMVAGLALGHSGGDCFFMSRSGWCEPDWVGTSWLLVLGAGILGGYVFFALSIRRASRFDNDRTPSDERNDVT